ncbi:MAG TPA: hypothetical protein VKZ18_24790 [Polyangia bacterium]|nr:hypothetical protein [Polyangia bacterium]
MSVRDFDRRARRVQALLGSINQPRDVDPGRPLEFWTTGERRRRLEQLEQLEAEERAEAAAEFGIDPTDVAALDGAIEAKVERDRAELAAEFGIDPADVVALDRAIAAAAQRGLAKLAAELGMSSDDEATVCTAVAERAAAQGDHELAARWRRLAAGAAPAGGAAS